jgi:hypothetical protein
MVLRGKATLAKDTDMNDKKMRVFISHGFKDTPLVRSLYSQLKQEEWIDPWLDAENLQPAQDWQYEILMALHSSNVGLICISKNALPLTGQFKSEIQKISELTKTRSKEEYQILILRLDDAQLPEEIASHPTADMQEVIPTLRKIMES